MQYEICFLTGESKEAELSKIKGEIREIIEKEGGKISDAEFFEKRKMAYRVKGEVKGTYTAWRFDFEKNEDSEKDQDAIESITRKINLNSNILRFIIVKAEEFSQMILEEKKGGKEKKIPKEEVKKNVSPNEKKAEKASEDSIDKKLEEILNI